MKGDDIMLDILLSIWLVIAVALMGFAYGKENLRIRKEMNDRS